MDRWIMGWLVGLATGIVIGTMISGKEDMPALIGAVERSVASTGDAIARGITGYVGAVTQPVEQWEDKAPSQTELGNDGMGGVKMGVFPDVEDDEWLRQVDKFNG